MEYGERVVRVENPTQIWRNESTGKFKKLELEGTKYACDADGFKANRFFPAITGSKKFETRRDHIKEGSKSRLLPKDFEIKVNQQINKDSRKVSSYSQLPALPKTTKAASMPMNNIKFGGYAQCPSPQKGSLLDTGDGDKKTFNRKRKTEMRLKAQVEVMQQEFEYSKKKPFKKIDNPLYFDLN